MAGIPVRDIFQTLINESKAIEKPDLDEVCKTKKKVGAITVKEVGIPKIDVVVAICEKYYKKIPLAVASSGYRDHVIHSLESNGILHYFDAVVTAEDICNPKPAPDIFLEAARRIECDPIKCRGFEDGDVGLEALSAAGMEVIDVKILPGYPSVAPSEKSVLVE